MSTVTTASPGGEPVKACWKRRIQEIHCLTSLNTSIKSSSIGARVPDSLKTAVHELAALSGQSISAVTEAALREYIVWRVPQLLDLQEAVQAADRGEFAGDDEVNALFARHGA